VATGTITVMTSRHESDTEGDVLANKVRALVARLRGSAMLPAELRQDVIDTLASAVQTVHKQESRMYLFERATHDAIWEWDLAAGQMRWNANIEPLLGYQPHGGASPVEWWHAHLHPDDRTGVLQRLETVIANGQEMWIDEYRFLHANGTYVPVRDRAFVRYDKQGRATQVMGAIQTLRPADEHTAYDALHDALTGLPNRQLFLDRLSLRFERVRQQHAPLFAVIYLDLDRFRTVNESYGHAAGDELLCAVAERLKPHLRASDSFARLGSDEFALLLDDVRSSQEALDVCARIQMALAVPFAITGHTIFASCTQGVALYDPHYQRPDELLRDAAIAMSRARLLQPGSLIVFEATMHADAIERVRIEADLRQALERDELSLHFQPIVTTVGNAIVGVEALVRWKHPVRGMIPPAKFIPVAEETGLIVPLGEWVLRTACTQAKLWHEQGFCSLYVAVNLSARQFKEHDLDEQVIRILDETGLPASYLHLELTETTLADDVEVTINTMQRLKATGVRFAIDDFGMGYSSLSYLRRLPISTVKLDRSFVREIQNNPDDAAIATAIIDLAHGLNLETVAEGVETEAQLAFLKNHRCEAFQGYLCSPAIPASAIDVLLRAPSN
jgi:diguanylate cyclase (GGDEF)-like protein